MTLKRTLSRTWTVSQLIHHLQNTYHPETPVLSGAIFGDGGTEATIDAMTADRLGDIIDAEEISESPGGVLTLGKHALQPEDRGHTETGSILLIAR